MPVQARNGFAMKGLPGRAWCASAAFLAAVVLVLAVMLGFLSMMEKAAQFDYDRHGFEGYPGNVGLSPFGTLIAI